jgi:hypothetical protein
MSSGEAARDHQRPLNLSPTTVRQMANSITDAITLRE